MADILASTIVRQGDRIILTLLDESRWSDGSARIGLSRSIAGDGRVSWRVEASGLRAGERLLVRRPPWASDMVIDTDASAAHSTPAEVSSRSIGTVSERAMTAYAEVAPGPQGRVSATARIRPMVRLQARGGALRDVGALGATPVEGALFYGPWLLAVDEAREPLFLAEPWSDNVVTLPRALEPTQAAEPDGAGRPALLVSATYEHGGFSGAQPVTLAPLGVLTRGPQRTAAVWIRYRNA
jgi:hypothetical protein